MVKSPKKTVGLSLPVECHDKIKALAGDTYRTVPSYIRMIVYNYLRRLEQNDVDPEDWWVVN